MSKERELLERAFYELRMRGCFDGLPEEIRVYLASSKEESKPFGQAKFDEVVEALESFGLVWGECEECESSDGYAYLVPMDVMDEFREKQEAALARVKDE